MSLYRCTKCAAEAALRIWPIVQNGLPVAFDQRCGVARSKVLTLRALGESAFRIELTQITEIRARTRAAAPRTDGGLRSLSWNPAAPGKVQVLQAMRGAGLLSQQG